MELLTRSLYFRGYAAVNRIFPTISSSRLLATTSTIVVNDSPLQVLPSIDLPELIQRKAIDHMRKSDEPFNIVSIGDIVYKIKTWFSLLPRVHSYFALKCNVDRGLLATLLAFGFGFEGVSKDEIDTVLKMGAAPEKIVFANPCKPISHIKLLLRLKFDDAKSTYELGKKYGVEIDEVPHILQIARELRLNIVGVSYHVGGGYTDASTFVKAIELAKTAFNYAVCSNISGALDKDFPIKDNIHILAEPDRYFAETAFTLVVCVIGKRKIYGIDQKISAHNNDKVLGSIIEKSRNEVCNKEIFNYYVNDGRYGSFSEFLMSYGCRYPKVNGKKSKKLYSTCLWGPTVSGSDCIFHECYLPELEVGDLIYFEEMGAYTSVLATNFNGFTRPVSYYVIDQRMWNMAKDKLLAKFKVAHEYSPKIDTFNQIEYE
ncbi:Ornithine decarboxylase, partial [Trichoplax sp. H2]